MSILSPITSFICDIFDSASIAISTGLGWAQDSISIGLDTAETALIDGLDLWIGFLLDQPQFALIGGWIFFLWWQLRWERTFPKKRDRELGFLEIISQTGVFLLGCIIWPFLALGKLGPQEAIFKIFSWKPTRYLLKTLSLGA